MLRRNINASLQFFVLLSNRSSPEDYFFFCVDMLSEKRLHE